MKNLNTSLGHLFHNINLNMRKKLEKEIRELGLSSSHQFGVLLLLSRESLSQKEISDLTFADEPTTTRMINRMIDKNLIGKKRSDKDKRKQVVFICEKGENVLSKALPISEKINKEVSDLLSLKEEEELLKILNKLYGKI